ncbi:hypothetical protein RD110_23720 [Rhodoferax koreense]|uniref:Uncharacterized protein n=1 Tax=Rhodoferax koreensis TaxID=1842727 RepID=A0A1P8K1F4_9BURK|nr:hypothetical protein [Rhodoferax koreense]APW39838.1 hypothetical protein RD110_23720 [Rhodoferax koreense]
MIQTKQFQRPKQRGYTRKDGDAPLEHPSPQRPGHRPIHPQATSSLPHPAPAVPRALAAWRQANSRTPDTLLPGHGGAFSNGDRRRASGRSEFHGR